MAKTSYHKSRPQIHNVITLHQADESNSRLAIGQKCLQPLQTLINILLLLEIIQYNQRICLNKSYATIDNT